MLKILSFFVAILAIWPITLIGQVKSKLPEDLVLNHFFSFGGHLNTRGWDVGLQYEKARVNKTRHLAVLQLSYMRDRAEIRRESLFKSQNGTNFVMNKVNYFMMLHAGFGRSFTLFDRDKFNRARLSAGVIVGPSLGLIIPYKIYRFVPSQGNVLIGFREEASFYDDVKYEDVIGELGLMRSTRNMRYCPGATIQMRLQLDMGEKADFIRAISLHLRADYFYRGVTIVLPNEQFLFLSGGIGFMIGNAW
jgi:hypothetical protein